MADDIIPILGATIEVVVSSEASNNTCCVFIETTPPGSGPPPHRHDREEEIFTVLEGQFEFWADGVWSPMKLGVPQLCLRGRYHAFRNAGTAPGRMMLVTNNGGIDEYFRQISKLQLPDDMQRLVEISACYGYHFLPIPPN